MGDNIYVYLSKEVGADPCILFSEVFRGYTVRIYHISLSLFQLLVEIPTACIGTGTRGADL